MSIFAAISIAIKALPTNVALAWVIAWRDFQSRYVGSQAGYLWAILSPALYGVAFVVVRQALQKHGVTIETDEVNPIVFAFFGIAIYQVWFEALTNQLNHLRKSSSFLKNMRIAPEIFAFSQLMLSLLDLMVRVGLICVILVLFQVPLGKWFIFSPIVLIMAVFTGSAIGYALALPSSFYSDIPKFVQAISLAILLGSPVFYPATKVTSSVIYWMQFFNPLAVTLDTARTLLFGGDLTFFWPALIWTCVLLLISVFMLGVYRVVSPLIVERM